MTHKPSTLSRFIRPAHTGQLCPRRCCPGFRRGSAEIELLIACVILLSLLLLVAGTTRGGAARLTATQQAAYQAFHDATESSAPLYTNDPAAQPIQNTIADLSSDRVHAPHPTAQARGLTGGDGRSFSVTVGARAAAISPAWAYSGYPIGQSDQAVLQRWFDDRVRDAAGIDEPTRTALGLSDPWQP